MKILCAGDNNVDIYPEEQLVYPGGNCVNVAAYVSENGGTAAYLGNLGKDDFGQLQKKALEEYGVQVFVRWQEEITSNAIVYHIGNDRQFGAYDNSIHVRHPLKLSQEEKNRLSDWELLHTSRYAIFAAGEMEELSSRIKISYDFSNDWEEEEIRQLAPYLTYAFFSCDQMKESEIWSFLKSMCCKGCKTAVATRGADGAYVCSDGKEYRREAFRVSPVDTIGAGDSFIARFLQVHMDLEECIQKWEEELKRVGQKVDFSKAKEDAMQAALSQAALYAARNCMKKGAFSEPMKQK